MKSKISSKENKVLAEIIKELVNSQPNTDNEFMFINRCTAGNFGLFAQPKTKLRSVYQTMIKRKEIAEDQIVTRLLKIRPIRTLSGVTPVTVLTKPYPCPGNCIYCPNEPGMPKSYLSTEPGAMRAVANKFDPYLMTHNRLRALLQNGHQPDKIELLVLGGTWSAYPKDYREWFIKRCFEAANYFPYKYARKPIPKKCRSANLQQAQKINETAAYRIIGITLETRPDWVTEEEIQHLRKVGCTRMQLGIQVLDDKILKNIKRGHTIEDSITATRRLRENGFKIDYHVMQNLPGSTPKIDQQTIQRIFSDAEFKPDQLKIYPTIVNKYAPLYKLWKSGKYKPYSHGKLFDLLIELKKLVPYYCRINRLIRDFPMESISAGNNITNLREMLQQKMKKENVKCKCIRCREATNRTSNTNKAKLFVQKYSAGRGKEYFISYESIDRSIIFGFARLRLNSKRNKPLFPEIQDAALLRELHVYGQVIRHDDKKSKRIQHRGLGLKLMQKSEVIAKKEGIKKMAVISGIGVREYYKNKLGYKLEGTYMTKEL
ncbi:MAG: tRNA uridine(34) 5-carboxymethylaminomethyl modification radical SAM/GNAT enzyme Elp3 [bacterium]